MAKKNQDEFMELIPKNGSVENDAKYWKKRCRESEKRVAELGDLIETQCSTIASLRQAVDLGEQVIQMLGNGIVAESEDSTLPNGIGMVLIPGQKVPLFYRMNKGGKPIRLKDIFAGVDGLTVEFDPTKGIFVGPHRKTN